MSVKFGSIKTIQGKKGNTYCVQIRMKGLILLRFNGHIEGIQNRLLIFGDCKPIKGAKGIYEMRIHLESGYRIYYGKYKEKIVLLLCGGDKGSQKKDIQKSYQYWQDYLEAQRR